MGFADVFNVGGERKRKKESVMTKLFDLRRQKNDVPEPQYLPASSLLS